MAKQPATPPEGDPAAQKAAEPAASEKTNYATDAMAALRQLGNLEQTTDETILFRVGEFARRVRDLFAIADDQQRERILREVPQSVHNLFDGEQFSREYQGEVNGERITWYIELARASVKELVSSQSAHAKIASTTEAAKAVQAAVEADIQSNTASQKNGTTPRQQAEPSAEAGQPEARSNPKAVVATQAEKSLWEQLITDEGATSPVSTKLKNSVKRLAEKAVGKPVKEETEEEKEEKKKKQEEKERKEKEKKETATWDKWRCNKARWVAHGLFGKNGWVHKYVDIRSPDYVLRRHNK